MLSYLVVIFVDITLTNDVILAKFFKVVKLKWTDNLQVYKLMIFLFSLSSYTAWTLFTGFKNSIILYSFHKFH